MSEPTYGKDSWKILSTETVSNFLRVGGRDLVGIFTPSALTGATYSFVTKHPVSSEQPRTANEFA